MNPTTSAQNAAVVPPSEPLRDFVSHYWLSLNNLDSTYMAFPDGAVDLVIQVSGESAFSWLYGTTTKRTDLPLGLHDHYLGVRFKPGQSRHFIKIPARELTNDRILSEDVLQFSLDDMPERIGNADVFIRMNELLERHLASHPPERVGIDDAIAIIQAARGTGRIQEVAEVYGKSARQFERIFLETVGISAKCFAAIERFWHATTLMKQPLAVLAGIAADAGYSDQSHMTHDFRRLAGLTPGELARARVVFLQDQASLIRQHGDS
ncbi:DUF6597 domain-containing transcriptional factor [Herbaspirillum sp. GCM10030257]|uniref:DUF6597 domain-containing transcriptional factor n=1 Tax=Herbaspirillum sp. GCM10030257 TaxID=3273393 RepID=UPI0036180D90